MHYAAALVTCVAACVVACARLNPSVTTGQAAASAFVNAGKPIHPRCLVFSQEGQSREAPNEFGACAGTAPVEARAEGWAAADSLGRGAFSWYRVLARKNDRFLLALESSGGGTGQFSDLSWVRLTPSHVVDVKDVLGGDRCAGGLSDYQLDGTTLHFASSATAAEILRLSGARVADSLANELNAYSSCDGRVSYRYDLVSEKLTVASVTLRASTATDAPAGNAAHACFSGLARRTTVGGRATLATSELEAFGARFVSECAPRGSRERRF
ncbi:MAG TPA: hypothetical protein VH277_11220 [Gemmatimonadaceae bacterium]|nr:hypothetical protein [Gemmatimonadaceae bacterium]